MPEKSATAPRRTSLPEIGNVDGRGKAALTFKTVATEIADDLGGKDRLSRAQWELVRRAAGMATLCAQVEADILSGQPADVDAYTTLVNALSRVLARLGLQRTPKDITPDLRSYLAGRVPAAGGAAE